jgi:TolB protein
MTVFKHTTNPWDAPTNSDVAKKAHQQNALVNYTHVAQQADDPYLNPYTGKAIPIDVALGNIDSLDINNSYNGTVPLWYRLLNCGFRLTASAGTDCFLNRIKSRVPGGDRVYVKLDGPLDYSAWIENLRAGKSFVTNGPMLTLRADCPARAKFKSKATESRSFHFPKLS